MKQAGNLPSLRQLRAFATVAEVQSVSRASALINLSQPAVTQAIANLEAKFGVALFERGRGGSHVTPFGQILLARVERLFELIRQGLEELFGTQSGEHQDVAALATKITSTHIRCLLAVSENTSFDQAARSIGVSQPSLHRAARDFERHLRRVLYYRGPHGTTTTKQGSELARRFKLAMRELDYAFDEINTQQGITSSRIAIGMLPASGSFVLGRAINEFLAQCPGARVQVVEEPYEQLLHDLRSGNIDVLFSVLRRPAWATDVTETKLFDESYAVVMRPKHPLSKVARIGRDELAAYDWIVPGPSTPRYLAFERLFASARKKPTTEVLTASRGLMRALLTTSDRLTMLARHEALLEEQLGVLRIVPAKIRLPQRTYGVATRTSWRPTALQQTFLKMLASQDADASG